MFGTRADLVVDLTLVTNVLAPVVALASLRLVRRRRYNAHRLIQIALLVVCVLAVVALEVRIRLAGGSGALVSQSPEIGVARAVLAGHISVAVLTYLAWGWLAVVSSRRFMANLPGTFSSRHRRIGWLVFAGLCFNAISATTMYCLTFVA